MAAVLTCPDVQTLEQFFLGHIPEPQLGELIQHFDGCSLCLAALQTLQPLDTLAQTAASLGRLADPGSNVLVQSLMRKLRQMNAEMTHEQHPTADSSSPAEHTEPGGGELDITFLAPPQTPDELGRLGPYRILSVLGCGGMGVVFKAEDPKLQRIVALKAMKPSVAATSNAGKRFLREARTMAAVKHDHLATIYQVDEDRGVPYLAMEFLDGEPLDKCLKRAGKLPIPEVLRIGREIALGLAAAHARGLIHRDIKPGNVWLESVVSSQWSVAKTNASTSSDRREPGAATDHGPLTTDYRVKILDFGLARAESAEASQVTQYGTIVGTPAYMAPEQGKGGQVDARADLFSLGCVLYVMSTGRLPFQGVDAVSTLLSVAMDHPQPPQFLNDAVPAELSDLILKLLAKKPEERCQSAHEVIEALTRIETDLASRGRETSLAETISQTMNIQKEAEARSAPTSLARPVRVASRKPGWLAAAAIAFLFLGPLAYFFGGTVIRFATNKGELVIETDDRDVEVLVKHGGAKPEIHLLDKQDPKRTLVLHPGDYEIEVTEKPNGLNFFTKQLTLRRGGKETVKVWLEPMRAKAALPRGGDPDRRAAEWVLSIGGTIKINEHGKEREIAAVGDLPRGAFELTYVDLINNQKVSDAGLAHFKDCKNLTRLTLDGGILWTNAGLAHFKDCKNLTDLFLGGSHVSDTGVAHFKDCKNLTSLDLFGTQVSDAGLAHFRDCKNLRYLRVNSGQVSDAGLAHFKDCKNLTNLDLGNNTQVSHAGLAHFKDCKNLTNLNLYRTQVSDAGLAQFKDCKNLTNLNLYGTQVSDAGLAHFKDCKNLSQLNLYATKVSDAGLAPFKNCKNLTILYLKKTKVTAAGIDELKKALPLCKIEWDGGVIEPQTASPLDALDPAQIPAAERFPWQPKELVAVIGEHRQRHWGAILSLAISPDGKQVASGGNNGQIRRWDIATQQELTAFKIDEAVASLAYSLDGKWLACGGVALLQVWDVSGTKPKLHKDVPETAVSVGVYGVAFSPDGKTLVCSRPMVEDKCGVKLWDLSQAQPRLRAHYPLGDGASFSPDGKTLAFIHGEDRSIRLYDLVKMEPKQRAVLPGKDGKTPGFTMAIFATDNRLATMDPERTLRLWDVSGPVPKVQAVVKHPNHHTLAFSEQGGLMVTAGDQGVMMWQRNGVDYVPMHGRSQKDMHYARPALSPDGKTLITIESNGALRFWEVGEESLVEKNPLKPHPTIGDMITFPTLLPHGPALAFTTEDSQVHVWRFGGAAPVEATFLGNWPPKGWTFAGARDGKTLATTGDAQNPVRLWHAEETKIREAEILKAHKLPAWTGALSPDGATLATAFHEKISLWDLHGAAPKETSTAVGAKGGIQSLTFSPDGRTLFSVADGIVRLWNVTDGKLTEQTQIDDLVSAGLTSLAIAPDGKMLAIGTSGAGLYYWSLGEGKPRKGPPSVAGSYRSVAFSPDGRTLVAAGQTLTIWEVATGRKLREWTFPGPVRWAAYAPDGRHLFTANSNGTIYVLRLEGKTPAIPAAADPDRRAAEWVLSIGGGIKITKNGQERQIGAVGDLPQGAFELTAVYLAFNPKVSDAGLAHFKDCKSLTDLNLYTTQVSDTGLAHFKDCKNLTRLQLGVTKLSDAGLAHFKDCKNFTLLALGYTQVSDAGLARFRNCKNLTHLNLDSTRVSDAGLAHFKDCKDLIHLFLNYTQVSDAGLTNFKDCKNLTSLALNRTKVSDAGLAHFKDCKNLTSLDVRKTKASAAGIERLHQALPGCRIESDGGVIEPTK